MFTMYFGGLKMIRAMKIVITTFLLIVSLPNGVKSQDAVLTPEMMIDLNAVTEVSLSPWGNEYAYVLRVPRSNSGDPGPAYSAELWVGSLDGDEPRQFTFEPFSIRSPRWSPGGDFIGFLSARRYQNRHTQVYSIPIFGGEARKLTEHETSVRSFRWSPDGEKIAFTAPEPQTEKERLNIQSGRDWTVVDEDFKLTELWIMYPATGMSTRVIDDMNVTNFEWSQDGGSIIFQASERPGFDNVYMFQKIFRVAVENGLPEVITPTFGKLGSMAVSPDGEKLAYLGAVSLNDPIAQSVFIVQVSGGKSRNITEEYQGSVLQVHWLDNRRLLMLAVEGVRTIVYETDVRSGSRRQVIGPGPVLSSIDIHAESGRFMAAGSTTEHPSEVFTGTIRERTAHRFTDHNPNLKEIKIARQEAITWKAEDGWEIQGILTYPLDYGQGQRYPLVLLIHGGPEGYDTDGWTTRALYPVQLLAARGYIVLQPNYRGSGGRGVEFSKADHNDLGGKEFRDVLAGIDALADRGLVDPERVGAAGWSYGGYFSGLAATRYSERFKAAVFCAGLSNWISFAGTTDIPYEMSVAHWNSWWYDEPDLHWERSPISHIDNAETPTLVIHGSEDARVHPGQSREIYTALKLKGIPTQLVLYPREGHGLSERAHQLDYMDRVFEWFDRYLK
jgi:dipeptidyl aminopeptidase/acylaminoacyl peptidase